MAATAVYAAISPVGGPAGGSATVSWSNISATPAAFHLIGGEYILAVKASTYGTVTLKVLLPDGTTYGTAMTAISADGISAATKLPDGTYELVIA